MCQAMPRQYADTYVLLHFTLTRRKLGKGGCSKLEEFLGPEKVLEEE